MFTGAATFLGKRFNGVILRQLLSLIMTTSHESAIHHVPRLSNILFSSLDMSWTQSSSEGRASSDKGVCSILNSEGVRPAAAVSLDFGGISTNHHSAREIGRIFTNDTFISRHAGVLGLKQWGGSGCLCSCFKDIQLYYAGPIISCLVWTHETDLRPIGKLLYQIIALH